MAIDLKGFITRLKRSFDAPRIDKTTKMLKAERFQLFSDVADGHVLGVVKSQSDPTLVYSCKLNAEGKFACCTQNLNPCGGLRGALCKHLLVLIIGLAQAGQVEPDRIYKWVQKSKKKKPELEKDAMSETFLRYKGAQAGEVDWRPAETIPEDYYSL